MIIENVQLIGLELTACGIQHRGCSSSGTVKFTAPDTDSVAPLVWAAHGQPLTSNECLDLQAAITNEQWLAYVEARKMPIKALRAERYKTECDPLYLKVTEDALKANITPDYTLWLTLKDSIRSELPYE